MKLHTILLLLILWSVIAGAGGTTHAQTDTADIALNAAWGTNVSVSVEGDTLRFQSDGLPDHGVLDAYAAPNGTSGRPRSMTIDYSVPLNPVLAATPTNTNMGPIGVSVSGAVFFKPYEAGGTYALEAQFEIDGVSFIDACGGHPEGRGLYHYHGVPYCITDVLDAPGEHSTLIGYLLDGFPVYGPQDAGGAPTADLDACNGHFGPTPEFPAGVYHYHMTETAPYSIPCYSGEVDAQAMRPGGGMGGGMNSTPPDDRPNGGQMGPPGGGPPNGNGRPPGPPPNRRNG